MTKKKEKTKHLGRGLQSLLSPIMSEPTEAKELLSTLTSRQIKGYVIPCRSSALMKYRRILISHERYGMNRN
jgi:hypothetical protein